MRSWIRKKISYETGGTGEGWGRGREGGIHLKFLSRPLCGSLVFEIMNPFGPRMWMYTDDPRCGCIRMSLGPLTGPYIVYTFRTQCIGNPQLTNRTL